MGVFVFISSCILASNVGLFPMSGGWKFGVACGFFSSVALCYAGFVSYKEFQSSNGPEMPSSVTADTNDGEAKNVEPGYRFTGPDETLHRV